jgi:hypothetical protein
VRADKIKAAAQAAAEADAEAGWQPRRDGAAQQRPAKRVDKLYSMCLSLLVEYIDDVETLLGLPTIIKVCCGYMPRTRVLLIQEQPRLHIIRLHFGLDARHI